MSFRNPSRRSFTRATLISGHALMVIPAVDFAIAVGAKAWLTLLLLAVALSGLGLLAASFAQRVNRLWLSLLGGAADGFSTVALLLGLHVLLPQSVDVVPLSAAVWYPVWIPVLMVLWASSVVVKRG